MVECIDSIRIARCPELINLLCIAVVTQGVVVYQFSVRVFTQIALAATENGIEEEAQCKALIFQGVQ